MPDSERAKEEERFKEFNKKAAEAQKRVKDNRAKFNIK
jgi:hypothetical protein